VSTEKLKHFLGTCLIRLVAPHDHLSVASSASWHNIIYSTDSVYQHIAGKKREKKNKMRFLPLSLQLHQNTTYLIERSTQINILAPLTVFCKNLDKMQKCSFLYQKRVHHCKQVCNTIGGQAMDDFKKYRFYVFCAYSFSC